MQRNIRLTRKMEKIQKQIGENIKLARLRRKLSGEQVSERADINRKTLTKIENGDSKVGMGYYMMVLFVLGLEDDLLKIAKDDELGRKLQDAELFIKKST